MFVQKTCIPLYTLLLALGNPSVHYFSLDIEGAELKVEVFLRVGTFCRNFRMDISLIGHFKDRTFHRQDRFLVSKKCGTISEM